MSDADRMNFVIAAYTIAALVLAGMIGFILRDYFQLSARLRVLQGKFGRGDET
jgi:heme exporter protein CcmD